MYGTVHKFCTHLGKRMTNLYPLSYFMHISEHFNSNQSWKCLLQTYHAWIKVLESVCSWRSKSHSFKFVNWNNEIMRFAWKIVLESVCSWRGKRDFDNLPNVKQLLYRGCPEPPSLALGLVLAGTRLPCNVLGTLVAGVLMNGRVTLWVRVGDRRMQRHGGSRLDWLLSTTSWSSLSISRQAANTSVLYR